MNFILCDIDRERLMPFTITKPVAELLVGMVTMRGKWEHHLGARTGTLTEPYLAPRYPHTKGKGGTCIDASVFPSTALAEAVRSLRPGEALMHRGGLIACALEKTTLAYPLDKRRLNTLKTKTYRGSVQRIEHLWDLFRMNDQAIRSDFAALTAGRKTRSPGSGNTARNKKEIFIEPGAVVEHSYLNADTGPIYIGKDAHVMAGCLIQGPVALGEGAVLKMGTRVYGATTIGPFSKAGGEINNSILSACSNKGHDGFLGNSVIGEWCNLGAGTNNSNLKNNYGEVSVWNYRHGGLRPSGLQFCGLFMGDHSRAGINTMFNTGTVTGVNANIFGAGFPPKFIPSFSWGDAMERYKLDKAMEAAAAMYKRRGRKFGKKDRDLFSHLYRLKGI